MRKLGNMFNVHNELFRWTIVLHNFFFLYKIRRRRKKKLYTSLPWSVIAVIDNKLFLTVYFCSLLIIQHFLILLIF